MSLCYPSCFGERSGLLLIRAGKGNKVRSVPLNGSAREAIAVSVAPRLQVEKASIKAVAEAEITRIVSPSLREPEGGSVHDLGDGANDSGYRESRRHSCARRDQCAYAAAHLCPQLSSAVSRRSCWPDNLAGA